MNLVFDDLYAHQDELKVLLKPCTSVSHPLEICEIVENYTETPVYFQLIAILKIKYNYNYEPQPVAYIYRDAYVYNKNLTEDMFEMVKYWLSIIVKTPQKRSQIRVDAIKEELMAKIYHPSVINKLEIM